MYHCPSCGKKNRITYNFCNKCGYRLRAPPKKEDFIIPKPKKIREFRINEYVTLKLERGRTVLYVNEKKFTQCKYLLLEIPIRDIEQFNEIDSIDEASEKLDHSLENRGPIYTLTPETEFWGHCSNLQVWMENNYDTRLLHSNLAFPLLKKLTDIGDPLARNVFKEQIAKRIESGHEGTINYLITENYLNYFTDEEREVINDTIKEIVIQKIQKEFHDVITSQELNFLIDLVKLNIYHSKILKLHRFNEMGSNEETFLEFKTEEKQIVKLNIINSQLSQLPKSISNLSKLKELNLMGNHLRELPDEISQLSNLEILNVNSNFLKELPHSIGNMCSLKELKLNHNELKTLPESISELFSLKKLFIWGNDLESLQKDIGNLRNLNVLGLSFNKIASLPSTIGNLKSLHTLDLSNNLLRTIPEELSNLKYLSNLWLNNNQLTDIPLSLIKLESLHQIYLFGNPITNKPTHTVENIMTELENNDVNIR